MAEQARILILTGMAQRSTIGDHEWLAASLDRRRSVLRRTRYLIFPRAAACPGGQVGAARVYDALFDPRHDRPRLADLWFCRRAPPALVGWFEPCRRASDPDGARLAAA